MQLDEVELEARGLQVVAAGEEEGDTLLYTAGTAYGHLRQLHLDSCGINRPFLLLGGESLQQVHLQRNQLQRPPQLASCILLQVLDLSRNQLQQVADLSPLTQLQVLLLGRNQLTSLQDLAPLTSLEVLDIHRNSISDLTPLTALQRLRLIHASHNRLRSLPNLRASSSLQELNVQRNQLTALTCLVTRGLQDHQQQQGGKDVEGAEGVELVAKTMTGTLRAGRGTMLPAAAAAAAAASTGVDKRLPDSAPSSSSEEVPALALPISLQHLLADHNQLPDLGHLAELEGLTRLVTLSVTGNPAVIEANLPAGLKPREGVLLCCPVGLLLLDDQQVSADERMVILGASHRRRMQQYHLHGAAAGENPYVSNSSSSSSSHAAATVPRAAGLQGTASIQQQQRAAGAPGLAAGSPQQVGAATGHLSAAPQASAGAAPGQLQPASTQEQPPGSEAAAAASKQWHMPLLEQPQQKAAWEEEGTLTAVLRQLGKCSTLDHHQQQDTLQQQQQQETGTERARSHYATSAAPMGAGNTVAAAAASVLGTHRQQQTARPGSPTSGRLADLGSSRSQDLPVADRSTTPVPVSISKPELEANYLRTEGLLLGTRGPTTASERAPFRPGVVYNGIVLSITGESGLSAVRSPVYAGISELQLLDIPFAKILESWDGVMALPRLTRLQLRANRITSLCQLHPLLQLPLLKQVVILDSPVCHLVLLRPYVAFRFPQLQAFNGEPLTEEDLEQGLAIFSPLEAAMQSALAQAPQQAALAAAGLSVPLSHGPATAASALLHSSSMRHSMAGQQVQAAPVVVAPLGPHLWCHLAPGTAPLVPPKHQSAGAAFAQELLQRATQVQEQLGLLQDAWPAAMDQLVADGWQGQYVLPDK